MTVFHSALLCVVLLLPGSSLDNWRQSCGPNLQSAMHAGALGLVNVRTAERDTITPLASCLSIGASARVRATTNGLPDTQGLGYSALGGNLGKSLSDANVDVVAVDPLARAFCFGAHRSSSTHGEMIVEDLSRNPVSSDREIGDYRRMVERKHGLLIVLSTNPSKQSYARFDRLTPVLFLGPQQFKSSLVTSPSTRTKGLITNTDIAPTIAAFFGVPLEGPSYGVPIHAKHYAPKCGSDFMLSNQNNQWIEQEHQLSYRPYIAAALAILVALGTGLTLRRRSISQGAAGLALLIPSFLLSNTLGIAAAYGCFFYVWQKKYNRYNLTLSGIISSVTTSCMVYDAYFNCGSHSATGLLGYSPIEGARYYGIGNEAMGVWLGASAIAAGALLEQVRGRWLLVFAFLVAFALGNPLIGAKAGGLLAASLTILGFWWAQSGRSFKPAVATLAVAGVVALSVGVEALMGRFGASHVTQALAMAHHDGAKALVQTIVRKAAMNIHLLTHSVWAILLVVNLVGAWLLLRGKQIAERRDRGMIFGTLSAVLSSLIFNDAGVVAASICSLYFWSAAAAKNDSPS